MPLLVTFSFKINSNPCKFLPPPPGNAFSVCTVPAIDSQGDAHGLEEIKPNLEKAAYAKNLGFLPRIWASCGWPPKNEPPKKSQDLKKSQVPSPFLCRVAGGWGVPSVGPASLLPLLLNTLASSCSHLTSFSATYLRLPLPLRLPLRFRLHGRAPTPESPREPILRLIMLGSIFGSVFCRFVGPILGPVFVPSSSFFVTFSGPFFDPLF